MRKAAIISDLHKRHWDEYGWHVLVDNLRDSIAEHDPDVIIDAGDCECDLAAELDLDPVMVLRVKGNHDWYGLDFDEVPLMDETGSPRDTVAMWDGQNLIIGCTLWTDYGFDPMNMLVVNRFMADPRFIKNFSPQRAYAEHAADRKWLEQYIGQKPTIVVTHHAPSFKSVHPKFRKPGQAGDIINHGFASNLDALVQALRPKLWVHGHMHDPSDYMIGDTRVVANPCGYPKERGDPRSYKPLFVEL
jgi:predicted phosphodiesterase